MDLPSKPRNVIESLKRALGKFRTPGDYESKIDSIFGSYVVDKTIAGAGPLKRLPRFVSEYLVSRYTDTSPDSLTALQRYVHEHLPDAGQAGLLRHKLLTDGRVTLIDNMDASVDLRSGNYVAGIPSLNETAWISPDVVKHNPGLLMGGMWGAVELEVKHEWVTHRKERTSINTLVVREFEPFEADVTAIDKVIASRHRFTLDEWIRLLLASVGLDTAAFPSRRQQLLLLARLIPLAERNVNLLELGPRQTGKTFLLRNASPQVFLVSGGTASAATLFGNLAVGTPGVFMTHKVVVFDEIGATSFTDAVASVSLMKDYLESGQFSRGANSYSSDASLVMVGNIDVDGGQPLHSYAHLFEPLPDELQDTAFLDRIHGYLPGWELPKISRGALSSSVGLVSNFFGEYLLRLRDLDVGLELSQKAFGPEVTQRDFVAIERLGSGLLKLLYPDGRVPDQDVFEVAAFAVELRQRVHDQLVVMAPGEFKPRDLGFRGMRRG